MPRLGCAYRGWFQKKRGDRCGKAGRREGLSRRSKGWRAARGIGGPVRGRRAVGGGSARRIFRGSRWAEARFSAKVAAPEVTRRVHRGMVSESIAQGGGIYRDGGKGDGGYGTGEYRPQALVPILGTRVSPSIAIGQKFKRSNFQAPAFSSALISAANTLRRRHLRPHFTVPDRARPRGQDQLRGATGRFPA